MKAVINAILTDPEARCNQARCPATQLREPVLFGAAAASTQYGERRRLLPAAEHSARATPFLPASVFNYYPPTYVLPGTVTLAPEFAIQNSSTAINRYNFANTLSFGTIAPLATLPGAIGTKPDWTALSALAGNPNALLDKLNVLLLHGTMPAAMRASILPAINAIAATDPLMRAKTAFYLVVTSPQYQVER